MDLEALAERVTERLWQLTLDQVKEAQGENEDEENGGSNKIETDSSRIEQDVVNEADSQQNPSELQIGNVKMRDKMGKIKVKEGEIGKKQPLEQQ
ncbi:unnamed protein product [Leuciscus chuanchicus]